jgi:CRP-like cAMP-binding protein
MNQPIRRKFVHGFGPSRQPLGCETTNQQVELNIIPFPKLGNPKPVNELVTSHPFLAGLKPRAYRLFCQSAAIEYFAAGQEIFHQDGKAERFYLIESGHVVLETFVPGRGMATIQTLGPGEALGWSWLFPPYQWRFSAMATEPTEVIAFEAECLRKEAQRDHKFYYELVVRLAQVLAGRLEGVRTQLIDIYQMRP